ncbi:MAG: beta-1,6-N-acetylglucosaminyltransferase [Bacteroidota bacterium]|jgi:hypothetical protein
MKIGFLVLAHQYPDQLKLLVKNLLKLENSRIYIHIDKKSDELFRTIKNEFKDNSRVFFTDKRYKVYWGSYNQILATLSLIDTALKYSSEDYYMLISGQDYLIKKSEELIKYLDENKGSQYLVHFKLPSNNWKEGGTNRLEFYNFDLFSGSWLGNKINGFIYKLQKSTGYKRKIKFDMYGGTNWFNLSLEALTYVGNYVKENPEYLKCYRYTRCADEMFIQCILLNSQFKDSIVSDDLRYVDWITGPDFPKILTVSDFDKLINVDSKFFARKFDVNVDKQILNKIDLFLE